jgi:uncharacterized iron-regulated membrane protein
MLSLSALAEAVERQEPRARVGYFSVSGPKVRIAMTPRKDPVTGAPYRLGFDHVFADPWTGRILRRTNHDDLIQGGANLVPFIWELHQNLALGPWGTILLGAVAILWTIDCFVALWLTLPRPRTGFWRRWAPAWAVKRTRNAFRLNYDLHRAGGLWTWLALLAFAWSSVMFCLPEQVYQPLMTAVAPYESDALVFEAMGRRPQVDTPRIGWREAERLGARYMREAAARGRVRIIRPYGMAYIPGWNVYTYAVVSPDNLQRESWGASLWVDGETGALVRYDLPAGAPAGNQMDAWLRALHFGDLGGNGLYRFFVFWLGALVSLLSLTGVYIWLRKRRARQMHRDFDITFHPQT